MNITPQEIQEYWAWAAAISAIISIVWFLISFMVKTVTKWLNDIKLEIMKMSLSMGRTTLTPSQMATTARNAIWRQSEPKLKYLEDLLIKNSIHEREERLREQIKTELCRQSTTYIQALNEYNSLVWPVWDYVEQYFPMDMFLEEVYNVFFEKIEYSNETEKQLIIERKIKDIRSVMLKFQNEFINDFYNKIKE